MKTILYNEEKLSKLVLGTVQFGMNYGIANKIGKPKQENVDRIVDYVINQGINCFDTAQAYGDSENVLGKSLKKRDEFFVISKLKSNLFKSNQEKNTINSLSNLGIDSLYGLLLHDSKLLYEWKESYSFSIKKLKEKKLIKYFGVSIYSSNDFYMAIENENIDFVQIPFNIFDQRAIYANWFTKAKQNGKLIFIRSVFLQGLLLMDLESAVKKIPQSEKYIQKLDKYCQQLNLTRVELCLSFVNTVAEESLILFGCENIEQASENLKTFNRLKELDSSILSNIYKDFENIQENVYNPSKWNI